jgi:hypothetical protein
VNRSWIKTLIRDQALTILEESIAALETAS